MVELNNELTIYLRAFQKQFGDIVPLRELPQSVNTNELIDAIKLSIQKNENILPEMFGYGKLDEDPNVII